MGISVLLHKNDLAVVGQGKYANTAVVVAIFANTLATVGKNDLIAIKMEDSAVKYQFT